MKRKFIIILLMSILSLTACSKEPQESIGASEVIEDERQDSIIENEEQEEDSTEDLVGENETSKLNTLKKYVQSCEEKINLLAGQEYECDFMVQYEEYIYGYDLEDIEENSIDNYKLVFDNANIEVAISESPIAVPVRIQVDDKECTIGSLKLWISEDIDEYKIKEVVYSPGYNNVYYGKTPTWITEQGALIRNYDMQNRTVELCYVTLVEHDTYTGYEMEKEEWITVPLAENVKITSWTQDGCGCCYITENMLNHFVNDYTEHGDVFFCYIAEENGELIHIGKVLNP